MPAGRPPWPHDLCEAPVAAGPLNLYGNGTHTWPYWIREFKNSYPPHWDLPGGVQS